MKFFLNRKLVIAATAVAMLGGAAVALAATQGSSGSGARAYISDLAGRLGVSSSTLTAAIKAADSDRINAAVTAGRLTQTEANALLQRIAQSTGAPLLGRGLGRRFARAGFGRGGGDDTAAAAQYLGLSKSTLRADLASGQSLDAIAGATNDRSAAGLKTAIVTAETAKLDAAVSARTITGTQESRLLASLSSHLDAMLSRTWTGHAGNWTGGRAGGWARRGATGASGVSGSSLFGT
jgi:mRNA-degrading endonuclease toxin of MazEF toxin-antitoxin module